VSPTPTVLDADAPPRHLADLDGPQHAAATHGEGPLLVVAGAGTGKTRTLVARVAELVARGTAPERILLLTFTRRAAAEMLQRARSLTGDDRLRRVRGGTFHSIAHRVLQRHGTAVGLVPGFSVLDEGDLRDVVALVRTELGLGEGSTRFPRAETIAAVASRIANAQEPLSEVLDRRFPWCRDHADGIREVLVGARERKRAMNAVDFDDLLLHWRALLAGPAGDAVRAQFDHVLVDEYQDTNAVQADILADLVRDHGNLTVVGDDAQAIYGFRAASVDNILGFADRFPGTTTVRLERNHRSVQPVLDAANAVMAGARRTHGIRLSAARGSGPRPRLVTCADEATQSVAVCDAVLELREQGVDLREQAVLVRTGHHSDGLELELARRDVPFVKYGGLQFLQAAHVKDLAAMLRLVDNPADELAWHRVLGLLDGVGPATTRRLLDAVDVGAWQAGDATPSPLGRFLADDLDLPPGARDGVAALRAAGGCIVDGTATRLAVGPQVELLGRACAVLWPGRYEDAAARLADVERIAALAGDHPDRGRFLADLTLDPPSSTADLAGPPHLDDDWLTISTIHSAKGGEWRAVHVLHATDGNIPSDMALRDRDAVEEERRLLYVAMTRAKDHLRVHAPVRFHIDRFATTARHGHAPLSRFLAPVRDLFDDVGVGLDDDGPMGGVVGARGGPTPVDRALDDLWAG
jgi:DNA helicase-2/ATP-dependent DNA helicase PcrA